MSANDDRFEMKISRDLRKMLEHAAAISGQPLSSFIRTVLTERAREIVDRRATTVLTQRDFSPLLHIVESDDEPVQALKAAVRGKKS